MSTQAIIEVKFSDNGTLCMVEILRDGHLVELTKAITKALTKADNDGQKDRLNWGILASKVVAEIISKYDKAAIIPAVCYDEVKKISCANGIEIHPIADMYSSKNNNISDSVFIKGSEYGKHAFYCAASEANTNAKKFKAEQAKQDQN